MKYLIFVLLAAGCFPAFATFPDLETYRAEEDRLVSQRKTPEQVMAVLESGDSVIDLDTALGKAIYLTLFMTEENAKPLTLSQSELTELEQAFPEAYHEYQVIKTTNFPQDPISDRQTVQAALAWGEANHNRRVTNVAIEGLAELDFFVYPRPIQGIELLLSRIDGFPSAYEPKQESEPFKEEIRLLIGYGYMVLDQFAMSKEFCVQGLDWSKNNYTLNEDWLYLHVELLRCVATNSYRLQRFEEANQYILMLLSISEQQQLSYSVLYSLAEAARVNAAIPGNQEQAINYARRALKLLSDSHMAADHYMVYFAAALSYQASGDLSTAEYYIGELIRLSEQPELAGFDLRNLHALRVTQATMQDDKSELDALSSLFVAAPDSEYSQTEIDNVVKRGTQFLLTLSVKEKQALDQARRKAIQELARQQSQNHYTDIVGLIVMLIVLLAALKILSLRNQHKKAQLVVQRDGLTGLCRHSYAIDKINDARFRASQQQRPLHLAILNLWQLKHVNAGFGHTEGDNVIIKLAELLQSRFADGDIIGRYGGSGFVVARTEGTLSETSQMLHEVLLNMQRCSAESPCNEHLMSFTAGLVSAREGEPLANMLDRCRTLIDQLESEGKPGVLIGTNTEQRVSDQPATSLQSAAPTD